MQLIALISQGPTSVAVQSNNSIFLNYGSGIITSTSCGTEPNHAVLAVGYGKTEGNNPTEYYIIKNSWGTSWGESGYLRIQRNRNICGIANFGGARPIMKHL